MNRPRGPYPVPLGEGTWAWSVWHVAPDGTWWAAIDGGRRRTWREAYTEAAVKVVFYRKTWRGDGVHMIAGSVRKVKEERV